ncbi:hypothetical protein [Pseudomonas oryzihabitans]|uniref:Uncharacterized protein n=1 Tax=Pseudomonas oryzihabitans TaxID=47885 RepID=A0AAJ2C1P5_9PSED|nr:hypothetical protein [Pseudomonas psychrotolerans]MDR6236453.1 hypothetical protein [Pseudomonas psychrotolerans]MDR6354172.1 hypothetical protein [Pseudomonas psychrotolerans]
MRLAFEEVPFHRFIERCWWFICKPNIVGCRLKESHLQYAAANFVASIFLVAMVAAAVQYLLPDLFNFNISQMVNFLYLPLIIALQGIALSLIVCVLSSILLFPKKSGFHFLIFHQAILAHSVLNVLFVAIFWLMMNRVLNGGSVNSASSTLDLLLGGGLGALCLCLSLRLLIIPLWHYFARYYERRAALGGALAVIGVALWVNSYVVFDFGSMIINKSVLYRQLCEVKGG